MIKPHDKPDKPYDSGLKRLITICTQDLLDWLLPGATFTGKRSEQFQSIALEADILLEVLQDGVLVLINVEAQSTSDPVMADRLLEYSVLARRHYQYKCIARSYVIFLKKGGARPQSPLIWKLPDDTEILRFDFEVIELADIPYEKLIAKGLRGLLALVPLAKGGARREVVEAIINQFLPIHDTMTGELVSLTGLFASLAFTDEKDQEWLKRRISMLKDALSETPLYKFIQQMAKEEALAQVEREFELKLARIRLELLEVRRELAKVEGAVRESERQERLTSLRQKFFLFIEKRYPSQETLARELANAVEDYGQLGDLFLKVALTQNVEEAEIVMRRCLQDQLDLTKLPEQE